MADKLVIVKVGELPAAPEIFEDTLIPGERKGESQHFTGGQLSAFVKGAVTPLTEEAKTAAEGAKKAQQDAETARDDAGKSAAAAAGSETVAAGSAAKAKQSENTAVAAAGSAAADAASAGTSAGVAGSAAGASEASAQRAEAAAGTAAKEAADQAVKDAETLLSGYVADTTANKEAAEAAAKEAKTSETAAEGSKNAAGKSATDAAGSAAAAEAAKKDAAASQKAAEGARDEAKGSATAAAGSASEAAKKATAAKESETAAGQAADRAEQAAKDAERIAGGDFATHDELNDATTELQQYADGAVAEHNGSPASHKDIRESLAKKADLGADGKVKTEQLPPLDYDPAGAAEDVKAELTAEIEKKQDKLILDEQPMALSENPVKSRGIYTAIQTVQAAADDAKSIAEGRSRGVVFPSYQAAVDDLNGAEAGVYRLGDNIYILTMDVPDLLVSAVAEDPQPYEYADDDTLMDDLAKGEVQMGFYKVARLETAKVDLSEIRTELGKKANQADVTAALEKKQNILIFDPKPTAGSKNPVESEGIKTYVDEAIAKGGGAINDATLPPKVVVIMAGLDPTPYKSFDDVAADQTAMTAVAASSTAMAAVIASPTALSAVVSSKTAMTAVAASSTAMTVVAASSSTLAVIRASDTAMNALAASTTAYNALLASPLIVRFNPANENVWRYDTVYSGSGIFVRLVSCNASENYYRLDGGSQITLAAKDSKVVKAFNSSLHVRWVDYRESDCGVYYIPC